MSSIKMDTIDAELITTPAESATCRSIKQSTFSIDSILSHKMLSQQFKDISADSTLSNTTLEVETGLSNVFEEIESKDIKKLGTNSTKSITDNETIDGYRCTKPYSSDHWNNELSCNCAHCIKRRSKDRMFLSNRPMRDLSRVSYYSNIYDNPYDHRNHLPQNYIEDPSTNLTLSFHPSDDDRHSKRRRTIFTASQLERLEYEFQQQQYIVGQDRRYLARELHLNEVQVKVWFQNRRIKWRKYTHGYYPDATTLLHENDN